MGMNFTPELLVVDDRIENLELLRALLGKLDLNMDLVQSPIKALRRIEQKEYALIILDIQMPQMDGFLLAEKIRQQGINQLTPIIFLTAFYLDKESELKGYKCGCVDFMMKPFESSILINKVNLFLELYRSRKEKEYKNNSLIKALQEKELLENRLRKLATNYRTILEGQSELILKVNNDLKVEFANRSFSEFFDYSLDGISRNSLSEIHFDFSNQIEEVIKKMNGKRRGLVVEKPICGTKEADLKWIEWSVSKINELDDVHYMIVGRDVSDKRFLKESLVNKEKLLLHGESIAHIGSFEWDSYTKIVRCSEEFKRIFKISSEEIGISLEEIEQMTHPDDLPGLQRMLSNLPRKNQKISFQHRIVQPNKKVSLLTVEACVEYNEIDEIFYMYGVVRDVTKSNSFERAFKESLGQGVEVYDGKAFFELDENGQLTYLNDCACKLLGCSEPGKIEGVNILDFFEKDDRKKIEEALDLIAADNNIAFEIVNVLSKENINRRIVFAAHAISLDGNNGIRGIMLEISRSKHNIERNEEYDTRITEVKRQQMEYETHTEELKAKVEKELKINEFQRQLLLKKSELESLGKMASSVVHEINQPLTGISMIMDNILLRLSMDKIDEDYIREKCSQVFQDIDRIKSYLSQVGIFNSSQKDDKSDAIDVNNVIKDAISLVKKQYKNSSVEIKLDVDPKGLYVCGNKYKLEKVIVDILNNSYESIGEKLEQGNGVHEEEWIKIKTGLVKNEVVIEIKDNGGGIDPNNLNYIFEPFFSTKKLGVGSGLGLYISQDIIQKMNGKIAVKSKKNKYTEMKLILPFDMGKHISDNK